MSRTLALLAALAIFELSICQSPSMSENSTNNACVPANSESVAEAAEADEPARLIEDGKAQTGGGAKLEAGVPKYGEVAKTAAAGSEKACAAGKKADDDLDEKELQDEKETAANAYMSHDDSGAKTDPLLYYQAGLKFIKDKKYQLALDAFNKALEINPRLYEASYGKGRVYQLTGYDKFAARRFQDVLKYRPDMDEVRMNLASLHRKHKHYSGAEAELEAVIQRRPLAFEAHYNLANVLVEDNKMEQALKEYKLCLKLRPNNANLHNNMGVLFLQKNYPDEALQEFRKAAQLAPKNQMFRSNINAASKLIAEKKNKGASM
jgi:Tfp pilus assembly protein PilF